ncbi:MAG: hypothetical protein IPO92_05330 [Saprospiraceae bacterium]|nr:hypothetical protein [Saprospiraceae bacterium]
MDKPQNETDLYKLRYAEFVVPLVKAVQDQQKMIEELQKENAQLKTMKADIDMLKAALVKRKLNTSNLKYKLILFVFVPHLTKVIWQFLQQLNFN